VRCALGAASLMLRPQAAFDAVGILRVALDVLLPSGPLLRRSTANAQGHRVPRRFRGYLHVDVKLTLVIRFSFGYAFSCCSVI
jgi:hypothetical protein